MGDSASFGDLFSFFRELDPRFASMQDEAGRISDLAYSLSYKQHPGRVLTRERTYKDWARGEAAEYMRGHKSWRKEYEATTPVNSVLREQNVLNQLDRMDYMRGVDISQIEGLTPQERTLMVGFQNHLRKLNLKQALRAVRGDQTTGMVPTGFPFADLGLEAVSPETLADVEELDEPVDIRTMVLNIDTERTSINRAKRALDALPVGTTSYYDVEPGRNRAEYDIVTDDVIANEKLYLDQQLDKLTTMEMARNASLTQSVRPRLGRAISGEGFSSPKEFANMLGRQLTQITGETRDIVAMEETRETALLKEIGEAETMGEAVRLMTELFAESTATYAVSRGEALPTMTPMDIRMSVLDEAKKDYGLIRVELNALAREIGQRSDKGPFNASSLPGKLQSYIDIESFNKLAKTAGDPDTNLGLALHLWGAHQAIKGF